MLVDHHLGKRVLVFVVVVASLFLLVPVVIPTVGRREFICRVMGSAGRVLLVVVAVVVDTVVVVAVGGSSDIVGGVGVIAVVYCCCLSFY